MSAATGFAHALLPGGIFCFCLVFFLYSISNKVGRIVEQSEKLLVDMKGYEKQKMFEIGKSEVSLNSLIF